MTETIDHGTLFRLVEAGAVSGAHIVAQPGGWAVTVKYGTHERPLAAQRSRQVRLFRRFEILVAYLKEVGITQFDVDAANFDPQATRRIRPDRSDALKRTHEAAAYDNWFRAQVQASLNDPRPSIPDTEVKAHFVAKRDALRKRTGMA